ncbi:MAG: nucleoside phosphorylase [Halanaerobiaceae bacterium]
MENWQAQIDYRDSTGLEKETQYHIRCSQGDIAPVVIVPGDQSRVKKIVEFLDQAKKIAENRGLITYTGKFNHTPVSVTSTGMGGPSAAIAYEELINVGAKCLIRVGSVAGLQEEIKKGDIVLPHACIRDDGASNYYVPENYPAAADPFLYTALIEEAQEQDVKFWTGVNWTHSSFYSRSKEYFKKWAKKRVISMEMEASCLFTISQLRNVQSAFVGTVYENRFHQTKQKKMDLSVGNIKKSNIKNGERAAIKTALQGATKYYNQIS